MKAKNTDIIMQNKIFLWITFMTAFFLLIPFLAMQFTSEVNWEANDFIVAGTLLFGTGSIFVLAARKIHNNSDRAIIGIALTIALFYIWAELAVGIFTNWGS